MSRNFYRNYYFAIRLIPQDSIIMVFVPITFIQDLWLFPFILAMPILLFVPLSKNHLYTQKIPKT